MLTKFFVSFDKLQNTLSVLIWAGGIAFCGTAAAQVVDTQSVSRLINTGQIEKARFALESDKPSETDLLFFEARLLKARGRLPEAIHIFREVLQLDPDYINARRELAHTLLLNREYREANNQFQNLLRTDDNDEMREGYRRFLNVIDQNKAFGLTGFLSITPSTNLNRGTTNSVFDTSLGKFVIDQDSQAKSGLGAQFGVSGYFRHLLDPTRRVALTWSLSGTQYEQERYNSAVGSIALSYEQILDSGSWFLTPYYRVSVRKDDGDRDAKGISFGLNHRLNHRVQISVGLLHEYQDYVVQKHQDGSFTSGSITLTYQISPSVSLGGGLGFEHSSPEAEHLRYDASKIFLGMSKAWKGGLRTSFGLEYGLRDFSGIFPLTTSSRHEDFYQLSVGVQHSRINIQGFTPMLSCFYARNRSNIAFYDYDATECQATVSRNF